MKEEHVDFLKSRFDMLLVTFLILAFTGIAFRAFHWGEAGSGLLAFAVDSCKLFSGALLTMITQRQLAKRSNDETVSATVTQTTSTTTPKEGI